MRACDDLSVGTRKKKRRRRRRRGEGREREGRPRPAPPTFAGLAVGDGLAQVAVVALLAVVAVAAGRVVATVEADASALAPRQLVKLHVEAAAPGVKVAVTGYGRQGHGSGAESGGAPETPSPQLPLLHCPTLRQPFFRELFPWLPCLHSSAGTDHLAVPEPSPAGCFPLQWRGFTSFKRSPLPPGPHTHHTSQSWEVWLASSLCPNPACCGLNCVSPHPMHVLKPEPQNLGTGLYWETSW